MAFTLETVVPWGRSFAEYVQMFCLNGDDLSSNILGCGDGPASFNVEAAMYGHKVVSCDPIYQFSTDEIANRVQTTYDTILGQLRENREDYVWEKIKSPEVLGDLRMAAMRQFLVDYEHGRKEGRYVFASLPELPFCDKEFDLVVCSHVLFTYSQQFSLEFHVSSVAEMCRVAEEVRIFPLLNIGGKESMYVEPVVEELKGNGYVVEFARTGYEFQKGGHTMLRVTSRHGA
jgi:hypothetical protein